MSAQVSQSRETRFRSIGRSSTLVPSPVSLISRSWPPQTTPTLQTDLVMLWRRLLRDDISSLDLEVESNEDRKLFGLGGDVGFALSRSLIDLKAAGANLGRPIVSVGVHSL